MVQVHSIDSLDGPSLGPYRTMRWQEDHRRQGIFVAEGEKVVRRLLESSLTVLSVLMPEKWFHQYEALLQARPEPIHAYLAPKEILERLTGFTMYQGVLAVARVPPALRLEALCKQSPAPRLFVGVEGLSSAENVGVVVRNCAAFGAQGLIVGETCCSPFLRRAVRSSMGAVFRLPVVEVADLVDSLGSLRRLGIRCVAAHPHAEARRLSEVLLDGDCCLVLGSEGEGISPRVLAACDASAAIPMQNTVDSLNVASAAAAFLYEANRQRGRL